MPSRKKSFFVKLEKLVVWFGTFILSHLKWSVVNFADSTVLLVNMIGKKEFKWFSINKIGSNLALWTDKYPLISRGHEVRKVSYEDL